MSLKRTIPLSVCRTDSYDSSVTELLTKLQGWAVRPKSTVYRDFWKRSAVHMFTVIVTELVLQKQNHKAIKVEDTSYLESNKKKDFLKV